jgi:hypothetical protein
MNHIRYILLNVFGATATISMNIKPVILRFFHENISIILKLWLMALNLVNIILSQKQVRRKDLARLSSKLLQMVWKIPFVSSFIKVKE